MKDRTLRYDGVLIAFLLHAKREGPCNLFYLLASTYIRHLFFGRFYRRLPEVKRKTEEETRVKEYAENRKKAKLYQQVTYVES
jgi:hypothetical protein